MKNFSMLFILGLSVTLMLPLTSSAQVDYGDCAKAVLGSAQGATFGGGTINPDRSISANALGPPNRTMFSLGFGSPSVERFIELDFDKPVTGTLTVFENSPPLESSSYTDQATWDECGIDDGYPEEMAAVYVKAALTDSWEFLGYATNKTLELGVDPPESNIHPNDFELDKDIRYVKIVDATDPGNFCNGGHDGFDVDAVCVKPFPNIEVDIDIKPCSDPNAFNIDGHGVIPVAILGSATFDVYNIEPSTLEFAGLSVGVKGKSDRLQCSYEDVVGPDQSCGPDGYVDLVCQFVDDDNLFKPGDGVATVKGSLITGQPIEGVDNIKITQ